jgi:hypothetical protein
MVHLAVLSYETWKHKICPSGQEEVPLNPLYRHHGTAFPQLEIEGLSYHVMVSLILSEPGLGLAMVEIFNRCNILNSVMSKHKAQVNINTVNIQICMMFSATMA